MTAPTARTGPAAVAGGAAAVAALLAVTLAAVPGSRGFLGRDASLAPVVAAAVAVHAVAWAARRLVPSVSLLVGVAAIPFAVAWTAFPGTTTAGLPLGTTWRAADRAIADALDVLASGRPTGPASPAVAGRLALAVLLVSFCAVMADQVGLRLGRPLVALVPSLTVVVLGATRAPVDDPVAGAGLWLAAAIVFLAVHQATAAGSPGSAAIETARPVAALAAVAVLAAAVVAPRLPGYGSPPVVRGVGTAAGRGGARLQGWVDLNTTLLDNTGVELFTVDSVEPRYWRLTSLDRFDGRTWTQSETEATGADPGAGGRGGSGLRQRVHIVSLRSRWLPAAYPAQPDPAGGVTVRGASSSVVGAHESRYGDSYDVVSTVPYLTEGFLRSASQAPAGAFADRYRALPAGLDPDVRRLALALARPGTDPYDADLALQSWFRTAFTYDAGVPPGSGGDALVRFLFRTRRGYCEQFAGAFAVLARAAGLPARVAIGFTPGERRDDRLFHVDGRHAHAWPEVYLEGAGWVAFEPTPGRGIPGAEQYTGVPAMQSGPDASTVPGPGLAGGETTPTTAPPTTVATSPSTTPATGPDASGTTPAPTTPTTAAPHQPPAAGRGGRSPVGPLAVAGVAGLLLLAAVPLAKGGRRAVRRRRSPGPAGRVVVAWAEAAEALAAWGMARSPAETALDHAARVAADERLPAGLAEPVLALAGRVGEAGYGREPPAASDVAEAHAAAARIQDGLRRALPPHVRLTRALDPRPLWRPGAASGKES